MSVASSGRLQKLEQLFGETAASSNAARPGLARTLNSYQQNPRRNESNIYLISSASLFNPPWLNSLPHYEA